MSETRYFHISKTGKFTRIDSLKKGLSFLTKKDGYLWLDFFKPTKDDFSELIEPLGLHPLSIEDCVDESQIPKIDEYHRNSFILFNAFHYTAGDLTVSEVDAFIGKDFLVTVTGHNSENRKLMNDIERTVGLVEENVGQGPAYLLHVILDLVVDQKFIAIEALEDEINTAEEAILSNLAGFNPADLLHLRQDLLTVRKSLFHEREVLVKICRLDCPFIPKKSIFFYRDIYDHLSKFFELTESSRDVVTSLMEMYLSMLNNQMTKISNDTNLTVRRLTFITTIFMPLTLLAGIGGMSEWSMMTGPENWKISYPLFLIIMAVLGVVNYYFLKWLDKRRGKKGDLI
jgi:magnesium transporter